MNILYAVVTCNVIVRELHCGSSRGVVWYGVVWCGEIWCGGGVELRCCGKVVNGGV